MAEQPNQPSDDLLSDHCYDGIQEYDNPTPGWWNWLFIASIVFAPVYWIYFHSPNQPRTLAAQYEQAYADNLKLQFGEIGTLEGDQATLVKYMDDPKWLTVGQITFQTHCISCHGKEGQGLSGPNLTDNYYIHVKKIEDIATVVSEGAKAGAMPAWGPKLHPNEVVLAAAYVASLRGENLPGKPAEGNEIAPWPSLSDVGDSTTAPADGAAEEETNPT